MLSTIIHKNHSKSELDIYTFYFSCLINQYILFKDIFKLLTYIQSIFIRASVDFRFLNNGLLMIK